MADLDRLSVHQLKVLLLLLEERSVSAAARRLGVTQPAVSHSLRALRETLDDALLVAGARGMVPTPRAAALAGPLRRMVRELEVVLGGADAFDPALARRAFVLAMWDGPTLSLVPALLRTVRDEAPGIVLDVRPVPPGTGGGPALEEGTVDLSIEVRPRDRPGLRQRALYHDDYVCLLRADHPEVGETLDLDTYVRLPHALISPQGDGLGVVDRTLAEIGRERHVALRIRYFVAAPLVVAQSDLVLTAPRSLAVGLAGMAPLRMVEPPLALPGFTSYLVWHERADRDPAHTWLRDAVITAAGPPGR
ncbi:MAG: LysR family transcriptional regulator [Myxococcota bacterium]